MQKIVAKKNIFPRSMLDTHRRKNSFRLFFSSGLPVQFLQLLDPKHRGRNPVVGRQIRQDHNSRACFWAEPKITVIMPGAAIVPDEAVFIVNDLGHPDFVHTDAHHPIAFGGGVDRFQAFMACRKG